MTKCPKCSEEIEELKCEQKYTSYVNGVYNLDNDFEADDDDEYQNPFDDSPDSEEYSCPECEEMLFDDEDEAKKFLERKEYELVKKSDDD